jgi:DNA-binding GntR family transcriptional regulator
MQKKKTMAPVKRSSLTQQVTMKLRQAILDGRIKAGERIIEEDIATMMKTSRGPVRDSLIELEHEGLVIRERNRGAMVVNLSAEDVEEVWNLRVALESLALRYAMERATKEDLDRLEGIVREISAGLKGEYTMEKAVDLDLKFHEQIVLMSGLKRLITFWQGLKSQIWFLIFSMGLFNDVATFSKRSDASHRVLLDTIQAKDVEKGIQVLNKHMSGYLDIVKNLQTKGKVTS